MTGLQVFVESKMYGDFYGSGKHFSINSDLTFCDQERINYKELDDDTSIRNESVQEISEEIDRRENEDDLIIQLMRDDLIKDLERYLGQDKEFEYYEVEIKGDDDNRDDVYTVSLRDEVFHEPTSYHEAIYSDDRNKWLDAIKDELDSHEKCNT